MKQIIENLELIQLQINKLVEEKGIFVLGNPFLKALLDTTVEDLKNLQHKQEVEPQRPFDKLKELWEGYKKTDCSCLEEYLVGKGRAYNSNTIHQWIAEHCGFLTTAEVRQAIQELKSSELIHKSSDDMRNEDY